MRVATHRSLPRHGIVPYCSGLLDSNRFLRRRIDDAAARPRSISKPRHQRQDATTNNVFLTTTPLEGFNFLENAPPQLSPHAVVVLELLPPEGEEGEPNSFYAFDFLPRDPKSMLTALALVSGKAVPAVGRERRLRRKPHRRCVLVGEGRRRTEGERQDLLSVARRKIIAWDDTPLVLSRYDCTHAAVELASELSGVSLDVAREALARASLFI